MTDVTNHDAAYRATTYRVSVLVLDVERDDAVDIARQFGQVAIVAGVRGGAAELLYCDPESFTAP